MGNELALPRGPGSRRSTLPDARASGCEAARTNSTEKNNRVRRSIRCGERGGPPPEERGLKSSDLTPDTGFLKWITRLVRDHRTELIAIARREGLAGEDALDAAQEAYVAFLGLPHARMLAFETEDSRRVLAVLVRNAARNRRRRHDRSRPHDSDDALLEMLPDESQALEELIDAAERHVKAFGCIQRLGEVQQHVVTLRLLEERTGADVAERLGTTPGNVAVILHRAKQALRACLDG